MNTLHCEGLLVPSDHCFLCLMDKETKIIVQPCKAHIPRTVKPRKHNDKADNLVAPLDFTKPASEIKLSE